MNLINIKNKKIIHVIIFIICVIFLYFFYFNGLLDDFLKINYLTSNTIFFRQGTFLNGKSIIYYLYLLFLFFSIFIFIFSKNKKKNIFLIGIILFLFMGYRNLYDYSRIIYRGMNDYTFSEYENKKFYEYGDYLVFTDKIRKYFDLDNAKQDCNIHIYADGIIYKNYWSLVYLKPCIITENVIESDYIIYYKKKLPVSLYSKIVLSYNDSYLLKMK